MYSSNLPEFQRYMDRLSKAMKEEFIGEVVRGITIDIFEDVVKETPQWSGLAASSWQIRVNGVPISSTPPIISVEEAKDRFYKKDPQPKKKGDKSAVSYAFAANAPFNNMKIMSKDKVQLSNPIPYVAKLEAGKASGKGLRAVNTPGAMVNRAREKHISKAKMQTKLRGWFVDFLRMRGL